MNRHHRHRPHRRRLPNFPPNSDARRSFPSFVEKENLSIVVVAVVAVVAVVVVVVAAAVVAVVVAAAAAVAGRIDHRPLCRRR